MIRLHYWEVNRKFYEVKKYALKRNIVVVMTRSRGCLGLEFKDTSVPPGWFPAVPFVRGPLWSLECGGSLGFSGIAY